MANPTLTYATLHEALSAITGYDVIGNSAGYLIKGQAGVQQITFNAGSQILKHANVTQVMVNTNPGDVLGMAYNLEPQLLIQNPTAGAQYAAKKINLSPSMRAILSQSGHEVGSTALQPITKMEVIQSTGSNTLKTTSRGLLTKVPLKAVMRACAVAQGVMMGIDIVETNPELCTKISNRIFGTSIDPSEIANIVDNTTVWANIKDGAVFITEDIINAIKDVFMEEGVYITAGGLNVSKKSTTYDVDVDVLELKTTQPGAFSNINYVAKKTRTALPVLTAEQGTKFVLTFSPQPKAYGIVNGKVEVPAINVGIYADKPFKVRYSQNSTQAQGLVVPQLPEVSLSGQNSGSSSQVTTSLGTIHNFSLFWQTSQSMGGGSYKEDDLSYMIGSEFPVMITPSNEDVAKYLINGDTSGLYGFDSVSGVEKIPTATYPTSGGSIATDYPDWWANRTETIAGVDDNDNITNVTWLPVDIFQPTGNDPADYSQTSTQAVTVLDDSQIPDIIPGIDYSIESDPDIDPDFDPYPQVYPQPNPQPNPGTDLEPFTPSTPTVDVSDGESPDPTIPILTTALTSGLAYVYNPTLAETKQLGRVLWTANFIENLKKIFVNPMDGIIGFLILYATPKTTSPEDIVLGYYNTHIKSKVVTNQYVSIDCGTVALNEYFKDARDYEPYTNVSLYLPFIGVVSLHADDVINSHVNIVYHVDVLTGTCLATVKVHKQGASAVVYQYPGNCSIQLPLSSGNYTNIITSVFSVGVSAVGGGALGAAKAVGRRAAGAIYGGMRAAAINSNQTNTQVIQSGCLGANAGAMGIRKPYFMIRRPVTSDAYAYNMQYGYPANKWVMLGGVSGFTRVKSVHLENIRCTDEEKGMIESALKEGVIF